MQIDTLGYSGHVQIATRRKISMILHSSNYRTPKVQYVKVNILTAMRWRTAATGPTASSHLHFGSLLS